MKSWVILFFRTLLLYVSHIDDERDLKVQYYGRFTLLMY